MRNFKTLSTRLAAIPALLISGAVMAQSTTPTTAVALAQSIDLSDAKSAGLIVVGLLVGVGVALMGARLILGRFMPKV